MKYQEIHALLLKEAPGASKKNAVFFKTGPGHYAEHDRFLGIAVPILRRYVRMLENISPSEWQKLIDSPFNEERSIALHIAVRRFQRGDSNQKEQIYQWYLRNLSQVNNWNLVDASAHYIIGAYLFEKESSLLQEMARSKVLWHRRIAIVATWYNIRQGSFQATLEISKLLLNDTEDLIHKSVGWMLREVGKKDRAALCSFLDIHARKMPRTMLRYAIEKFSLTERAFYQRAKQALNHLRLSGGQLAALGADCEPV